MYIQNSPIERYYQIIEKEVELDSKVRFYLATDSEEVKHDLTCNPPIQRKVS